MIGDLKYEEILSTSKELEECSKELIKLIEANDAFELKDLASTVEGYSKYLTMWIFNIQKIVYSYLNLHQYQLSNCYFQI